MSILDDLDLPADGPIYYGDLAPLRGWPKVKPDDMAAHHLAECIAHMRTWRTALHAFVGSGEPGEEPPEAVAAFRAAHDHLEHALNAFTIAALLKGWDSARICEALDAGDVVDEMAWEWLSNHLGDPEDVNDLFDRITHVPQRKVPEGQMTLPFGGAA